MSENANSAPADETGAEEKLDATTKEQAAEAEGSGEDIQLQLEDARSKADEHWNQCLRLQAELENTRRRATRDVENAHKYGLEKLIQELLPVIDSLELGLNAADGSDENIASLREGTELTLKMFAGVLEKFGVKAVDPMGEAFNPELHQAMTMQPSDEFEPNTVMAVMQKGYTLNERLVRPAMVMVAKAPE